jgi:hypothetical protein
MKTIEVVETEVTEYLPIHTEETHLFAVMKEVNNAVTEKYIPTDIRRRDLQILEGVDLKVQMGSINGKLFWCESALWNRIREDMMENVMAGMFMAIPGKKSVFVTFIYATNVIKRPDKSQEVVQGDSPEVQFDAE